MSHISGRFQVRILIIVGVAVISMLAMACGSDDADDPTAAAESTSTATVVASPTATAVPTQTATPEVSSIEISEMGCTQTYPGAFNPDGPVSFVDVSLTIANTGETDVPVTLSSLGGAIVDVELFDSQGESITRIDDTATNIQALVAGEEYEVSLGWRLFESVGVETCKFGILDENRYAMNLSGEFTVEAVQIFAP